MTRRGLAARSETFGFEGSTPWAFDALRLLFSVPRAYLPLVQAWDVRHPGTLRALKKLVEKGYIVYQPGVIVDTRTGEARDKEGRKLQRWRMTAQGRRALAEFTEDIRIFEDLHPHVGNQGSQTAVALLKYFDLDDAKARLGISALHAIEQSHMPVRLGRWWVAQYAKVGYITQLPDKLADVREVIPAHWRITRDLCKQLGDVVDEYGPAHLRAEFRLSRSKFLADIDPARVGITGATDYDHDVESQRVVAALLRSSGWVGEGIFSMEPRIVLPIDTSRTPWEFSSSGQGTTFYQPDGELRGSETVEGRERIRRYIVEYERFQSRRDAWSHIERFIGYMHTMAFPGEGGALLFVVDTDARRRSYIQLIEAFADHVIDNPHLSSPNPLVLAVSSVGRVTGSSDPLNLREWNRIQLPQGADTDCRPVLHPSESSPYDSYFGRG